MTREEMLAFVQTDAAAKLVAASRAATAEKPWGDFPTDNAAAPAWRRVPEAELGRWCFGGIFVQCASRGVAVAVRPTPISRWEYLQVPAAIVAAALAE